MTQEWPGHASEQAWAVQAVCLPPEEAITGCVYAAWDSFTVSNCQALRAGVEALPATSQRPQMRLNLDITALSLAVVSSG